MTTGHDVTGSSPRPQTALQDDATARPAGPFGAGCWPKRTKGWPALALLAAMAVGAGAVLPPSMATAQEGAAPDVVVLDQGWSEETRGRFYYYPQGGRMIPRAWLMALERAEGEGMFASSANLARYGFIPGDGTHPLNPDGLPIGFAIDPAPQPGVGSHVGLTCAACHTAEITISGQAVRIDGGAAHLDFDSFYQDLARAVERALFDPAAFERFAARLIAEPSAERVGELRGQLAAFQARLAGDATIRRPALESGFGRVDALTQILNALAAVAQDRPANLRPAIAPTSYPHLWLTPDLEFVQWNPVAANPIARNVGQVLGVFGTADLSGDPQDWYRSSALIHELYRMETWIGEMRPPRWDEAIFGPIDRALAEEGEALFARHCATCHNVPPYRRTDPADNLFGKTFIEIGRVDYREVGTDPTYVESLARRLVQTNSATAPVNDGRPLVPAGAYFQATVAAIVQRAMNEHALTDEERIAFSGFRLRPPAAPGEPPRPYAPQSITELKAGPLAGIWASGPYLHNGSVPTIAELLSPVEERRKVFWTRGRELDRERLGFMSDDAPGRFRFDTSLPGNRNIGHEYPPEGLTPDERAALIEYIKTL